jgi:hypothetical protein
MGSSVEMDKQKASRLLLMSSLQYEALELNNVALQSRGVDIMKVIL